MSTPDRLLRDVAQVIDQAKSLIFVVPDDTGFFAVQGELVKDVQETVARALELMRRVMTHYDEQSGEGAPSLPPISSHTSEEDFLREIGAAISSELAAQEVSNIAFAVRAQLMETYEALRSAVAGRQAWNIASHADTALRRAGKGLITVESTIREYEGLEPVERTWSRLHDSLEIRRLYCQFRRGVLRQGEPRSFDELASALRGTAHRIAILRDRKIYPLMRISDRLPIRRLQKRILTWLKSSGLETSGAETTDGPSPEEDGRRLWGDVVSFAELLLQVNHREELREHDRRLVGEWLGAYFPAGLPAGSEANAGRAAKVEHLSELEPLLGCSDELDELLLGPEGHTLGAFREPLERIHRRLNRPFEAAEEPLGSWS